MHELYLTGRINARVEGERDDRFHKRLCPALGPPAPPAPRIRAPVWFSAHANDHLLRYNLVRGLAAGASSRPIACDDTCPERRSLSPFNLHDQAITVDDIQRNLPPARLYQQAIRTERDSVIADSGALIAYSGTKTGRSPKDKRVVKHPESAKNVRTTRFSCTRC